LSANQLFEDSSTRSPIKYQRSNFAENSRNILFTQNNVVSFKIIIDLDDGWFRVIYVAKFPEAIYVLHCFKKKNKRY
jgi:phage-related protein